MLGMEDPQVAAAFLLCIASALFCLVWGIAKWNRDDPEPEPDEEIRKWAEEEKRVGEDL